MVLTFLNQCICALHDVSNSLLSQISLFPPLDCCLLLLYLASVTISLFIHTSFLLTLPHFLRIRQDHYQAWKWRFWTSNQLSWTPLLCRVLFWEDPSTCKSLFSWSTVSWSCFCLLKALQHPELLYFMITAEKAAHPRLQIPKQFFLVCKYVVLQSGIFIG